MAYLNILNPTSSPRSSFSQKLAHKEIDEAYFVIRELGRGTYGKVLLAKCKETGTMVALKVMRKTGTKFRDFQRELAYSYFLSPQPAIVKTYDVAFETQVAYVFAQEYAPYGDLFDAIPKDCGLPEPETKHVFRQIASALEFMHSKSMVHRDVKPENILVFDQGMTKVKLMDFGMTRKVGSLVRKSTVSNPYTCPEIAQAAAREPYCVHPGIDIWALGVLLFCTLSGRFPWESADPDDCFYYEFLQWTKKRGAVLPSQWRRFTPKLMKIFQKVLDDCVPRRCDIAELVRLLDEEAWIIPLANQKQLKYVTSQQEPITESEQESAIDQLAKMLQSYNVETKVNKKLKETRTRQWVQASNFSVSLDSSVNMLI